jgi:hypothetical protein
MIDEPDNRDDQAHPQNDFQNTEKVFKKHRRRIAHSPVGRVEKIRQVIFDWSFDKRKENQQKRDDAGEDDEENEFVSRFGSFHKRKFQFSDSSYRNKTFVLNLKLET